MRKITEIRLPEDNFKIGYICGLIDGEGCFTIELWMKIIKFMKQKKCLEKEDILEIAKIRDLMNNSSKLKSYKDFFWFKNHFYGDNDA